MNTNVIDPRKLATVTSVLTFMLDDGETVKGACTKAGISVQTLHSILCSERELALSYARAMEIRSDVHADETIVIADTDPDAARARNRIMARQWSASKNNSKKYGDRVDLNVTNVISADAALTAAAQRLRPVRDQRDITDVEILTPQAIEAHGAPDKQSVTLPIQAPDGEPDIFS